MISICIAFTVPLHPFCVGEPNGSQSWLEIFHTATFVKVTPGFAGKYKELPAKLSESQTKLIQIFKEMLYHKDCKLNYAQFYCDIEITGTTYSSIFYVSSSLNSIPSVTNFTTAIDSLLTSIPNLDSFEINDTNNSIIIESSVVGGVEVYKDELLTISVRLVYSISCRT